MTASPSCLRLLTHWARRAASRAAWTAGNSRAISTAMIAMTTSSSISVNPRRRMGLLLPAGKNRETATSASLHVRVAVQARLVEVEQLPRLFERDLAHAEGALDILAHARCELVGGVLHVMQDLADGVALDHGV